MPSLSDLEAQAGVIYNDLIATEALVDPTTPAGKALAKLHNALYKGATMLESYTSSPPGTFSQDAGGGKPPQHL